jgi:hypothetical protein
MKAQVFVVALFSVLIGCTSREASQKAAAPAAVTVPQQPGMTIYKDPATGRLLPLPADKLKELLGNDARSLSNSQEGLVETPGPAGGFMINLQGRFNNVMTATITADGKLVTECNQHDVTTSTDPPQSRKE